MTGGTIILHSFLVGGVLGIQVKIRQYGQDDAHGPNPNSSLVINMPLHKQVQTNTGTVGRNRV